MESRRISGGRCGALRRLPHPQEFLRRGKARPEICWRPGRRRGFPGACHTPKNFFGAEKRGQKYAGGPVDGWFAPRLDGADRSGLKSWSVDDVAEYLQSGRNGKSNASGPMAEVVLNSTSHMSDADVRAIAVYLKDLPPGTPEPTVTPPPVAQMADGEKLYKAACIACHEADGSGAPRIYPPLPGSANLQSADPASTLRIILDGAETIR